MNNEIKITYVKEKKETSTIIQENWDIVIIENKETIDEIKESIIGILDCTNLNEELEIKEEKKNNNKEDKNIKKIFILEKDISKHIFWVFPKTLNIEEKREIIKKIIIEKLKINDKKNALLLKSWKIYVIDSWINHNYKRAEWENNQEKRYNWCDEESIEYIKNELISEKDFWQNILKEILNELKSNFSKIKDEKISDFINNDYKWYLLNWFINKIKSDKKYKQENLDDELIKALAWKLLREEFNNAKYTIFNYFYNEFIVKIISNNNIKENIENDLVNKYFDFKNPNISDSIKYNLKNINELYKDEFSIKLLEKINKIYWWKLILKWNSLKIITNIALKNIIINKNLVVKKIIENLINTLILNIKEKKVSLPVSIISFLNTLFTNWITIKLSYLKTEQDINRIKDKLIYLINEKIKIEKQIKSSNTKITYIKEEIFNFKKRISINKELEHKENEIKKILTNIGLKNINSYNFYEKIDKTKKNINENILKINKKINYTNNSTIIVNRSKKLIELEKIKDNLKKKQNKIDIIMELRENIKKINSEIKKYEENKILLNSLENGIKKIKFEFNQIENKINQIIWWLENALISNKIR